MKKKCTFAAKLINVILTMILVSEKFDTFDTNKVLTLAGMRAGLFVSMGRRIPLVQIILVRNLVYKRYKKL